MASGYEVNGLDLDDIFAPYSTGTKPAATGYEVSGVDLSQRYDPISQGSAALSTGYKIAGGADLNTLFAALNTTGVTVGTQPGNVSGSSSAGDPSGTVTSNTTTCAGSGGGGGPYSYTWHIASGSATLTNPNSATTGVKATVNANSTLSGTMYCTISNGSSSINTNTVNWSLQNTTIDVSVGTQPGNVSGSSAAGTPSGTVTSNSTSCSGANGTGSYSYQWHITGSASLTNPNSATTAVTSSVNGGATVSGTMYCTITDSSGGSVNTNTVSWSLQNTSPSFTSAQHVYTSGSGTETVPNGATNVVIENWGPGGTGAYGTGSVAQHNATYGAGGAAGGYCRSSYSCSGGQTINYSVGTAYETNSTVTSGSLSITAMQANGGYQGSLGGGTSSGGNQANITGAGGGDGGTTPADGAGGVGTSGVHEGTEGSGGNGGYQSTGTPGVGNGGVISFYYTA